MRVLHVIPSLSPVHGGPSVVLPVMERALTAEGLEVVTVTTDDDGAGKRNGKGDGNVRDENGVARHYFRKQTEFYKASLPLSRWLKREIRNFDIVHIHALFSFSSIAAARAAQKAGVPYIIRPLGVLNQYGVTQRRAVLKKLSLRWVEGPALRRAAAVQFTMDTEQKEAEGLGIPFHAAVVPLGLEAIELPPAGSDVKPYVLYLSRIDPKKNIEGLLDAWGQLEEHGSPWRLVIAGTGEVEYLAELHAQCEKLGLASSVEWAGQVAGQNKMQLLANASVFTLPSHSENFGIAAAEAMLAGRACLFTPGVAIGAMAGRRGAAMVVDAAAGAIASGLKQLMADHGARATLGEKAKVFAQSELTAQVMGRRLKELYSGITKSAES